MKLKLTIILLLVLTSCYKIDRPEKPNPLVSKDKMVAVLIDIALMNSAKSVNRKVIEKNGIVPEKHIYTLHGIDSLTFAKSNEYYAFEIKEYQEIYNKVKDSLDQLKEKYKAIEVKQKKEDAKKDSIKNAQTEKPNLKPKQTQKTKKLNKNFKKV